MIPDPYVASRFASAAWDLFVLLGRHDEISAVLDDPLTQGPTLPDTSVREIARGLRDALARLVGEA